MKIALQNCSEPEREQIAAWGYQIVDAAEGVPVIAIGPSQDSADFIMPGFTKEEFDARAGRMNDRREKTIQLVHDLRSPLNAMQGYAELIQESSEGEVQRFANRIRTAAVQMTERLQQLRDRGV